MSNKIARLGAASLLALLMSFGFGAGSASAHVLKQDHGISAVLHLPPDDNPQAGKVTALEVSFGDAKANFTIQDCDCTLKVVQGSDVIQSLPLTPVTRNTTLVAAPRTTFPETGAYDVIISGSAKDHAFSDFDIDFPVRVAGSALAPTASSQNGQQVLIISIGSIVLLGMMASFAIKNGGRYDHDQARVKRGK